MKNGPSIPGWAVGLVIAVFAIALIGFGYKYVMGSGPLPESQYPKEAYKPPSYDFSSAGYTKDGKPVGAGRPSPEAGGGTSSAPGNPYDGAYGQRP